MIERLERIGREDIERIAYSLEVFFDGMARDHGVAFKIGPMSYDGMNQGKFTVLVSTISEDGEVNTPEAEAYRMRCRHEENMGAEVFGSDTIMQADWLGQTFKAGDEYTLLGWKDRAKKYPVHVRRKDGKYFGWTREYLLQIAAANPPQKR